MPTVANTPARIIIAQRILAKNMPFSTIYTDDEHVNAATTVLTGSAQSIESLFNHEIAVHIQCDNYIKADHLRDALRDLVAQKIETVDVGGILITSLPNI